MDPPLCLRLFPWTVMTNCKGWPKDLQRRAGQQILNSMRQKVRATAGHIPLANWAMARRVLSQRWLSQEAFGRTNFLIYFCWNPLNYKRLACELAAIKLQVAKRKTTKLTIVKTRSRKKDRLALAGCWWRAAHMLFLQKGVLWEPKNSKPFL